MGGLLLLVWFLIKRQNKISREQGQAEGTIKTADKYNEAQNKENEKISRENAEVVKEVEKTHETHDRLDSDPEYRKRVRDRFTRD